MEVLTVEVPDRVDYRCPTCGDAGGLTGVAGGSGDYSRWSESLVKELHVDVRLEDYDALLTIDLLDPETEAMLFRATLVGNHARVEGSLEDLEILACSLAAEVNHVPRSKRRERIRRVYATMDRVLRDA